MSVLVKVQLDLKPEHVDSFDTFLASIIEDTRSFDGCQSMVCYTNQDAPTEVVFVETWDSRGHYEKYFAWRQEVGTLEALGGMLASDPHIGFYDHSGH